MVLVPCRKRGHEKASSVGIPTIYPGGYAYYSRGPQRFHTAANLGCFHVTLLSNRIDWDLVNTRVKNNTIWVGNVRYNTIDCLPEHGRTPFGTGRKDQAYESHFRARINGVGNPVPSDVAVPELYNWSLEWCPTIIPLEISSTKLGGSSMPTNPKRWFFCKGTRGTWPRVL